MTEPHENIRHVCGPCSDQHLKPDPSFARVPSEWFIGKFCQIAFPAPGGRKEFMWVAITGLHEDETVSEELYGLLNNDPEIALEFKCGDGIAVRRDEIIKVCDENSNLIGPPHV